MRMYLNFIGKFLEVGLFGFGFLIFQVRNPLKSWEKLELKIYKTRPLLNIFEKLACILNG